MAEPFSGSGFQLNQKEFTAVEFNCAHLLNPRQGVML